MLRPLTKHLSLALLFFSTLFLITSDELYAQKTFSGTGDWSDASKWSPSGVPGSSDIILIASGATLNIDINASCDSLYFIANSVNSIININPGISLSVTNNVRFTDPLATSRMQTINVDAGNFTCNTVSFANTSANSKIDRILLSTGNITVENMVMEGTVAARNQVVCSGSGTIELKGTWTGSFYTFTASTSTFIYSNSLLQNIRAATYNKLILINGNKVPNGNVITNDSLIIRPGATLTNSGNVSLTLNSVYYIEGSYQETSNQGNVTLVGLIHITSTGTFQSTVGEAFSIRNGIRNDGVFISGLASGTYTFSINNQSLSGSKMISFAGAVNVTGVILTNEDSVQITGVLGSTGNFVNDAGSYLRLNGATTSITTLTTSGAENQVVFGRSAAQAVPAQTYENLSFIGASIKTASGNITINDELNIAAGATFVLSTFTLNTGMGFSNTGTGTLSTANVSATPIPAGLTWLSTVSYNSLSPQTIVNGIYSSLNGTGANRTLSPTGTIFISGTFTVGAGTYSVAGSSVNFNGTGSQTIPASTYFNLISSSSGARILASSGTIYIAGTFTQGTNAYTVSGSTIDFNNGANITIPAFGYNSLSISDSYTKTIPGNLTLLGNLSLANGKLAIGSNTLTVNGIVSSSATSYLISNGSSNITLGGSGSATIFLDPTSDGTSNRIETFTINRGTTTVTMGNSMHINTALTLTSGRIALGNNTLTLNGTLTSSTNNYIVANGSSNITITGTGNMTLFLDQSVNNTTNRLGTLSFNRSGSVLTMGGSLQANTALTLTNGQLNIGSNTLTLNGTVTSTAVNNFIANGSSIITYGGTGNTTLFLDQSTPGTTNRLTTLTFNRASSIITQGNELRTGRLVLTGQIAIGSNSLIISSTAGNILGAAMSASSNIICNGSSILSITTSDNVNVVNPVLFFDQSTDGVTNKLASFVVNLGNSSRSLTLGNNLYVETALTLTRGDLAIGSNTLTLNGALNNDASNFLIANGSSNLTFGNTGNTSLFLSTTTPGTTNSIATLIFNRTGNILTLGSALHSATALTLTNGQLALGANLLTINGILTSTATNNFIGSSTASISFTGSGNASLFLDQTTDNTTNRLAALTVNRNGNVITQTGTLRTARLSLNAGQLSIGSNSLFISGTAANILGAAMSSSNNLICNGSSNLSITTSDNVALTNGTLFFDQTTPGTSNRLAAFTVNLGNNARFLSLGSDLQANTALTLTQGDLAIGSNTLSINGTLTSTANNLLIANRSSSIHIAGSGALGSSLFLDQSRPDTSNRLANFTYNRATQTITLGNAMQVTGNITPTAGTLATAGLLTMISNASGTACLLAGSGSYISGNVTVQRFIPAVARRFRFMSSPVSGRTLNDWKGEFYITGPGGATNGFDATPTNSSTVYSYNEATAGVSDNGWTGATNITNAISSGRGYRVFMRGDRSNPNRLNDTEPTQNAVTVDVVGAVHTGNVTMPVSYTNTGAGTGDGWNLLGNPYACNYDWNAYYDAAANYTNLDATIYIYDPNTNGYKSYNANANSGSLSSGIIPSGAAFFALATATPTMSFVETYKVSTAPVALFKTDHEEHAFTIKLTKDSINSDELFIKYINEATDEMDKYDIAKLKGAVNISSLSKSGLSLTGNSKPFNGIGDTIPLFVDTKTSGDYLLEFAHVSNLVQNKAVKLVDFFANTETDLKTVFSYPFKIDGNNDKTYGKSRFAIVIGEEEITSFVKENVPQDGPFAIYPTVVTNHITLQTNIVVSALVSVKVMDISGRVIKNYPALMLNGQQTALDMSDLAPGNYLMSIEGKNGSGYSVNRFVKQ